MKVLIVAATWEEVKPLEEYLNRHDELKSYKSHAIELKITGAGSVFTAFQLGKILPLDNWDLVINLGICGSFKEEIPVGTTVNIVSDTFGDLGAEDDEFFHDIFELSIADQNLFPFSDGWLQAKPPTNSSVINTLQKVKGITVNTVSGSIGTIARLIDRFNPDVETMEGAAFLYCCLKESFPCIQVRGVSNYIEKRDRNKWNIPLAIKNMNDTVIKIIEEFLHGEKMNG